MQLSWDRGIFEVCFQPVFAVFMPDVSLILSLLMIFVIISRTAVLVANALTSISSFVLAIAFPLAYPCHFNMVFAPFRRPGLIELLGDAGCLCSQAQCPFSFMHLLPPRRHLADVEKRCIVPAAPPQGFSATSACQ
jgi:hypothetical protein